MAARRTDDSKRTPRSAVPPPGTVKPRETIVVHDAPLSNTPTRKKRSAKASIAAASTIVEPPPEAAAKVPIVRRRAAPRKKQALVSEPAAPVVSEDERRGLIAVAAYLRGEHRGFAPDGEVEDWLVAEKEVDALMLSGRQPAPRSGRAS